MHKEQPSEIVKRFKSYRLYQQERIDHIMSLTPSLEEVFARVSSAIGNDPVKSEPIARVTRHMADYQKRWGVTLSPIAGPSVNMIIDSAGVLRLQDDQGERIVVDVAQSARGPVLLVATDKPDAQHRLPLQEYLYEYVARQLEHAMQNNVVIS